MRTADDLERRYAAQPPEPADAGTVTLICVRRAPGEHECPARVTLSVEHGVDGDRWSAGPRRDPDAQVTLASARVAALVAGEHAPLHGGGDNFHVDLDLSQAALPPGTRLRLGTATLEISAKPHTGCKKFRERFGDEALRWVNEHGARRLRGVNCRVVQGGEVGVGDAVTVLSRPR